MRAVISDPRSLFAAASRHHEDGNRQDAAALCRRILAGHPNHAAALNLLGIIACQNKREDLGVGLIGRAIAITPQAANYHGNLGAALTQIGRYDEAVVSCRRALALAPDLPDTLNTLGAALRELGHPVEAAESFRNCIAIQPGHTEAHYNLSGILLAAGDFAAGWREYEWRWRSAYFRQQARGFSQPRWGGEAAVGQTVLIHAEQGFGDTLQFCRYAPLAAARGLRVILEVPPPLVRLIGSLSGIERVIARGDALPPFDLHCPMLSLPLVMGTTPATIPDRIPYLHADPAQISSWRARLATMSGDGRRVGLAWAGSPEISGMDRRRSLPPGRLAPLFDVPGARFFSLQKAGPATPAEFPLIDVMGEMADFADTAALVANLDLVIAVDPAVAHLAGALGKPVWLLDRFAHCWRWLSGRTDSPWYPALRIFRQARPGGWDPVIADVARALAAP